MNESTKYKLENEEKSTTFLKIICASLYLCYFQGAKKGFCRFNPSMYLSFFAFASHTLSSHISLSLSNIARSIQLCVDCCRQRSDSNSCSRSSYKLIPYFLHFSYVCHSFFKILKLYKTSLQFILIQNELNLHFLFVQNFSKTNSP